MSSDDPNSLDWELKRTIDSTISDDDIDDKRFVNKVILITGAGGQLGREGCIYFAKRGAKIAALDLNSDGLQETFEEIIEKTSSRDWVYKPYVCNVTNSEQVNAVVSHIKQKFSIINYLWNNAGYQGKIDTILNQTVEDFSNVMQINVTGMFIVLQAVAKHMIEQENNGSNNCAIVNTASVAGLRGTPAMVGYASSKAAVISMSICAAKEFAIHNIRVNAISPALIGPGKLWDRQNELHANVGSPYFPDTPDVVATTKINSVPLKRLGTAEEVVQSVAFLFSNDASYITGINLSVDGGMFAGIKA